MLRGILTVGAWTMASRILGFVRDILIASRLGTGMVADAFFVALRLPNLFRALFAEGAFAAAFVPLFTGTLAADGRTAAREIAEGALAWMVVTLAVLSVLGVVFMPQVMTVLAPGFGDEPGKLALTVELTRITFPYLLLICVTGLLAAVLNGLDRYAFGAGAPVLFNLCLMGALLFGSDRLETPGHALAYGVLAAGLAQLALTAWGCSHAGMPLRLRLPRFTPAIRTLMARMGPGTIGAGVTQLNLLIGVVIASWLPEGSISVLYYADRVNQLPLGVIGTAVGTALLPALSRAVRTGAPGEAQSRLNRAIEFACLLTLPAAVALVVSAQPIVEVLFVRGAFAADEATRTAWCLAAYAVGLPAYVLVKVLAPGFFSRGDTATPVKIAAVAVATNIGLALSLMGPLGAPGLALSTALAAIVNAGLLGAILARKGQLTPDARLLRRLPRTMLAAATMGLALWAVQDRVFAAALDAQGWRWLALGAVVASGGAVFAIAGRLLSAYDLRELRSALQRRRAT